MSIEHARVRDGAVPLGPDGWGRDGKADPLGQRSGLIGAPISRIDGPLKVRGAARFAAEIPLDGMVYAAFAYSTVAKGRIATLVTREAEAAPGVSLVMTYRNAPRMKPASRFLTAEKASGGDDLPIMQDDRIFWNGQPIAVVLGETLEQAHHAASLIRATFVAEPATTAFRQAKLHARGPAKFGGEPLENRTGDAETALSASPYRVDVRYSTPFENHNAMELHAVTLEWHGDELTAHDCTQGVSHTAWTFAEIFGIKEEQVHVSAPFVGGGFGGKLFWQHQVLGAAAAKVAGRPVRVTLTRKGVYRVVGGRAATEQRVAIGARADGRFNALIHTGTAATTAHSPLAEPFIVTTRNMYAAENVALEVSTANVDMLANTFMRAPGDAPGNFALECAVDELAERLAMDPITLRMRNEPEKDPTSGLPFSSRNLAQAYRDGAKRFGWDKRNPKPRASREGEWLIGMGCATAGYDYVRFPGGAARLTLNEHGRAKVEVAAHEMGMGTATVQTQIVAERLGLPVANITFEYGASTLPGVVLAAGSQQTASIGAAVIAAHRALVAELLNLVRKDSPLAGLGPDDVAALDGGLCKIGDPQRRESYAAILGQANRERVVAEASAPPSAELAHWSMHSYGAQFCQVRVNQVTGETRVDRFLGSFDCGRILNAKTAASQFRGGIIMGLGMALMEETQIDERNGRIMNPSLAEYHVPVHMDVAKIDVVWTDIPDPHAPMGAHGVGEIGITGVAAAIANAVYNATGARIRDLPITLDKVLASLV